MRLWEVLEGFGMFGEALEGSAGFAKFCKALGCFVGRSLASFGRLWYASEGFVANLMLCM